VSKVEIVIVIEMAIVLDLDLDQDTLTTLLTPAPTPRDTLVRLWLCSAQVPMVVLVEIETPFLPTPPTQAVRARARA
jgi:hypothetical protein